MVIFGFMNYVCILFEITLKIECILFEITLKILLIIQVVCCL